MPTALATLLVRQARELARTLLAGLPDRWSHTVGVARRAAELAVTVDASERDVLLAAAWLHDIGYNPTLVDTGFHSLDGARYLDRNGWPPRISALVAYHSGAEFVADALGLRATLAVYPHEQSPVSDALTYADQTTGPTGQRLPIGLRMVEMLARRGADSPQAQAHRLREPYLLSVAARVERRLRRARAHGRVVVSGGRHTAQG